MFVVQVLIFLLAADSDWWNRSKIKWTWNWKRQKLMAAARTNLWRLELTMSSLRGPAPTCRFQFFTLECWLCLWKEVCKLKPQSFSTLVCHQLVDHLPGSSPESFDGRMWEVEGWGFVFSVGLAKLILGLTDIKRHVLNAIFLPPTI